MKRIGCFHAHHSNIAHIESVLNVFDAELVHFVDPGLDRLKNDDGFSNEFAYSKVKDTLAWIAKCHVDAILVTCTFYTALLREAVERFPVPVVTIDDPLFRDLLDETRPIVLVFTNPNTVEGTTAQLVRFSESNGRSLEVETRILPDAFELIMTGRKEQYDELVGSGLLRIVEDEPGKRIVAAQLSMVPAARATERATGVKIANHLDSLASYLRDELSLSYKSRGDREE